MDQESKAVISRAYDNLQTTGRIVCFKGDTKLLEVVTIELPDLGNQQRVSCIPEGVYEVVKHVSPKFGRAFWVKDVPGRSEILIHKGNFASGSKVDTAGCILPGIFFEDINADGNKDVVESTTAIRRLLNVLPDKFKLYII